MNTHVARIVVPVLLLVVGGHVAVGQRPTQPSSVTNLKEYSDVLRGQLGFDVRLAMSAAVDTSAIRTRVELKLRQNGIRVGQAEGALLIVSCAFLENPSVGPAAYSCRWDVAQSVIVEYPTRVRTLAHTWGSKGRVATVGTEGFRDAVDKELDYWLDDFLNAWYKANPKR